MIKDFKSTVKLGLCFLYLSDLENRPKKITNNFSVSLSRYRNIIFSSLKAVF